VLGGDEELAAEGAFRGAAAQGFLCGNAGELGIIVLLGEMREDKVARACVEALGIAEKLADGVVGEMPGAAQDALLDDPGIGADLEHVEIVIGLEDQSIAFAQVVLDELGHVAEVGDQAELRAVGAEGEANGVGGIVRYGEGVNLDIADGEALAGLDGFDTVEALVQLVRQDAAERFEGRRSDEQRRLPQSQELGQAVAVVGVLVGDEDAVEAIERSFDGGEAGEGFALAESGVDKEASTPGLEQRAIARTSRRQNRNAQADHSPSVRNTTRAG
jgi:hypothetical protein